MKKKILSFIRIILIVGFLAVFTLLIVNTLGIKEGQAQIENVLGKDVKYFNDEFNFSQSYYKYTDEDNIQYWVNKATGKLEYLYNPAAENVKTAISESKARNVAYDAAEKFNNSFFEHDTICETTDNTYYEFYIFQLDDVGYKTGKFIIVKVTSNQIQYMSMHTYKNRLKPELGSCIAENKAISIAYSATEATNLPLKEDDKYLIKTDLYKDSEIWVWDITILNTTENDILNQADTIDTDTYFKCLINANSSKVLSGKWIEK